MKHSFGSLALAFAAASAGAGSADYVREVKPILAEHCYGCHGASQQKSALRLDTAALARKGGDHGPAFQAGKSAASLLLQAVRGTHPDLPRMPYKKPPLTDAQISVIAQWIDQGAKAPVDEQPAQSVHWAFVAPKRAAPPPVKQTAWIRNPIDRFVLAKLEAAAPDPPQAAGQKEGGAGNLENSPNPRLGPSPEADRVTLIRRLSLDLTGLPPTIAEVDAFLNDRGADAYQRLVDRLLASPHYGERWGRHWLDVARYADSNGYSIDAPRSIWKYRDWVIGALNRDLPFDQFVVWQLAGDLLDTNQLPPRTGPLEPLIATGFHRNTQINQEGGIDPEQFRVESVMDRVNTTATAFLGLTLACAQCHDHKFDPFTQREYYQFYAFFNNTIEDGHGKSAPEGMLEIPGETEGTDEVQKALEEAEADLDRYLDTKGSEVVKWEQSLTPEETAKLSRDVRRVLALPFAQRTVKQKRAVYAVFHAEDPEFKQRNGKLTRLEKRQPKPVTTLVMVERKEPRETFVFAKGDFTRPAARVTPGTPAVLNPLVPATVEPRPGSNAPPSAPSPSGDESITASENGRAESSGDAGSGPLLSREEGRGEGESPPHRLPNRLDLARWIVDPQNPLTARVIVNRLWQRYFGKGIVETENDFGTQGSPPSHPELLDWLACELMNPSVDSLGRPSGQAGTKGAGSTPRRRRASAIPPWSLKHLHRLIVTSATYRQSSRARPDLAILDPNNKLIARQNRLRLDAEIVRDVCLSASGLLNDKIGGPSVFPLQPEGVMNLGQSRREWKPSPGPDRYRRGLYTFFWRATPHPALMVFDGADGFSTCTRRLRSNTPLQALTLLNDQAFYEFARALAARVLKEGGAAEDARLDHAFRLCLARHPANEEKERLLDLLHREFDALEKSPEEARDIAGRESERNPEANQIAAWTSVSRVLLNLDETITRE